MSVPSARLSDVVCAFRSMLPFPLRFLYSELLKYHDGTDDGIFEPGLENKLQIKSDITFHLYIR